MENQFNHALNGIRTMMTVQIQSIRETGPVDDSTVAEFREQLAVEILTFKRAAMFIRQQTDHERSIERLMHHKLDELLEIMGSPHPDFVKAGFYVSPSKPADPLYFWAYQDLSELGEWIQESCIRDASTPVPLPQAYQAMVRHEFTELTTVAGRFREKGVSEKLVTTLMHPFSRFQSTRPTGLMHRELVNLRKFKAAILGRSELTGEKLECALHVLLYTYNVNTDESIAYCQEYLQARLDSAGSEEDQLEVLAFEKKLIRQATVKRNIDFDLFNDPLRDEMLNYIDEEHKFRSRRFEPCTPTEGATPSTLPLLKITVTNEQHAAQMRAMHAVGYFDEKDKDIIEVTGRLVLSNRNKMLGMSTYKKNFYTQTEPAAMGAFSTIARQICWMSKHWGPYGVPNLGAMDPYDMQKYILSFQ